MSRYRFLALSPPTIAYCAFHQALPEIPPDQYEATMRDLHERLLHESRQIAVGYAEFLGDLERKESLALITAVRDFLQTPLPQDRGEIASS